ncbi:MAG: M23 family metallopeptidase [candidate division Zixibacteria bacterium]|nr:M23 family metallopeptidase [candidate division Zixibacteria bacterium]
MKNRKRKSTLKKIISGIFVLFLGIFLLSGLFNRLHLTKSPKLENIVEKIEASFTMKGALKKNIPLYSSLLSFGLSNDDAYRITNALSQIFNPKRCQLEDDFVLGFAADSTPIFLEYRSGFKERFRVEKEDTTWVAYLLPLKLNCVVTYLEGEISNSLWESMYDKCRNPELIMNLTDIFAWEIDFLNEPRNGDKFRLVFEEYWHEGEFVKYGDILTAEYIFSTSGEKYSAFLYEDSTEHKDYYDSLGHSLRKSLLKSPLNYRRISSGFSRRRLHPIFRVYRPHLGVDYAAPYGTPVVAAGDGIVLFAGWKRGFGRYVEIRHTGGYITSYGHLSRYGKGIRRGARVAQKDVVGYVGSSGYSTGSHLDYRVRNDNRYLNPLKMSLPSAAPVARSSWEDFRESRDRLISAMEMMSQVQAMASSS